MLQSLENLSLKESMISLPGDKRQELISNLSEAEAEALLYDWLFWARPDQLPPPGNWIVWLVLAGRGYGKTRVGAEQVRGWVKNYPIVNLIGATADDARDIMIEGESGILAICSNSERPIYAKGDRCLKWPNGAKSLIFTADEPERLRGKQHMKLWADEICAWRYGQAAWDQAMFGLRLGDNPQAIVSTTPKPIMLLRKLIVNEGTMVTKGSTYDNKDNLAPNFFKQIISEYEGSRLGEQELNAVLLDGNEASVFRKVEEAVSKEARQKAPEPGRNYGLGIDFGKYNDFTVLTIFDDLGLQVYHDRFNHMDYIRQTESIVEVLNLYRPGSVFVDATGAGDVVVEMLQKAIYELNEQIKQTYIAECKASNSRIDMKHLELISIPDMQGVWFTNKNKGELITKYAIDIEMKRVELLDIPVQTNELLSYEYDRTDSGNLTMNAPKDEHDDCVVSGALANEARYHISARPIPTPKADVGSVEHYMRKKNIKRKNFK